MRTQVEPYMDAVGELAPLWPLQWAEVSTHGGRFPLAPRYEVYETLAKHDELALVTLRDDGNVLMGYCLCFFGPDIHAKHCIQAATDGIFVHPLARGRLGGFRLLRAMRRELRARGVHRWVGGDIVGNGHRVGRLLELSGFAVSEIGYAQWLGEPT